MFHHCVHWETNMLLKFLDIYHSLLNLLSVPGDQHCELNCRAVGFRFYVRQSDKVIDGTPCGQNDTSLCVAGKCMVGHCIHLFFNPKNDSGESFVLFITSIVLHVILCIYSESFFSSVILFYSVHSFIQTVSFQGLISVQVLLICGFDPAAFCYYSLISPRFAS